MFARRSLAMLGLVGLMATPVFAQAPSPTSPNRPAVTAPAVPSTTPSLQTTRPATITPSTTPTAARMINLNTAKAEEIDALPDIGAARSKAIVDERAKGKFKDWADFDKRMTGTSVNAAVKAKIKDMVTF